MDRTEPKLKRRADPEVREMPCYTAEGREGAGTKPHGQVTRPRRNGPRERGASELKWY